MVLMADPVERLARTIDDLASARELPDVMRIVRQAARGLTGADGVTFVLREGDKCHYADEDAIQPLWKGKRFNMSQCISGWVMLHREAVIVEDVFVDDRILISAYRPTFVTSMAMVPVRDLDPFAAIGAYWATRHRASEGEMRYLEVLADASAVALARIGWIR
jgi:GAF domain-containing protein